MRTRRLLLGLMALLLAAPAALTAGPACGGSAAQEECCCPPISLDGPLCGMWDCAAPIPSGSLQALPPASGSQQSRTAEAGAPAADQTEPRSSQGATAVLARSEGPPRATLHKTYLLNCTLRC